MGNRNHEAGTDVIATALHRRFGGPRHPARRDVAEALYPQLAAVEADPAAIQRIEAYTAKRIAAQVDDRTAEAIRGVDRRTSVQAVAEQRVEWFALTPREAAQTRRWQDALCAARRLAGDARADALRDIARCVTAARCWGDPSVDELRALLVSGTADGLDLDAVCEPWDAPRVENLWRFHLDGLARTGGTLDARTAAALLDDDIAETVYDVLSDIDVSEDAEAVWRDAGTWSARLLVVAAGKVSGAADARRLLDGLDDETAVHLVATGARRADVAGTLIDALLQRPVNNDRRVRRAWSALYNVDGAIVRYDQTKAVLARCDAETVLRALLNNAVTSYLSKLDRTLIGVARDLIAEVGNPAQLLERMPLHEQGQDKVLTGRKIADVLWGTVPATAAFASVLDCNRAAAGHLCDRLVTACGSARALSAALGLAADWDGTLDELCQAVSLVSEGQTT